MERRIAPADWLAGPWQAWHALSAERHHVVEGFAAPMGAVRIYSRPQPIPWSAVQAWCDRAGLEADDREFLVVLVAAMDREYLTWRGEKLARDLKG